MEKDIDFTLNASADIVFVIQYMVFTSLTGYVIIMWVVISGVKGQGDKCEVLLKFLLLTKL
jgi:hypothetical protein